MPTLVDDGAKLLTEKVIATIRFAKPDQLPALKEKFAETMQEVYNNGFRDGVARVMQAVRNAQTKVAAGKCKIPPEGWECSRDAGHEGPCAATPTTPRPGEDWTWGKDQVVHPNEAPAQKKPLLGLPCRVCGAYYSGEKCPVCNDHRLNERVTKL